MTVLHSDVRVQTWACPSGALLVRLSGSLTGRSVEAECPPTVVHVLCTIGRLWLRASGFSNHHLLRFLWFIETVAESAARPSLIPNRSDKRA